MTFMPELPDTALTRRFFLSDQCPQFTMDNGSTVKLTPGGDDLKRVDCDFAAGEAPVQKTMRPPSANSQAGKLLAALEAGETLTTLKAISISGGTEAARRMREVRRYLKSQGRTLQETWITTDGGARIKQYQLKA